jgi:hypothetical protein
MTRNALVQTLTVASIAGIASVATLPDAALAFRLAETQTISRDGDPATVWSDTFTFDRYDPIEHGGALARVEIELNGDSTTTLELTSDTDPSFASGNVGARITAFFSNVVSDLVIQSNPIASFGSPDQVVVPSATGAFVGPIVAFDTDSYVTQETDDLLAFTGNTTFDVTLLALGFRQLDQSGGNVTSSQSTDANATLSIRYYTVPEPLTILGTFAAAGIGVALKKRQSI